MENFKIPVLKNEEDARKKAKETLVKLFDDKMLTIDNYNTNSSVAFTGGPKSAKELRNALEKSVKEA